LINQQIRSFPTSSITINSKDTPTLSLNSYPVGKQSKSAANKKDGTLTSVGEQSFQNETKLTWSPKSWEGNYMLSGRKLTAYQPGYEIAAIINPALGTLVGQTSIDKLKKDIPLFVTEHDFDFYQSNLLKHPKGGLYLDIPMVNQGSLPFCAPATISRILKYYGRNVEMLDVAKVAGSSITRGTIDPNILLSMKIACKKLDVVPDYHGKPNSIQNFSSLIRKYIDRGLPLVWWSPNHLHIINGYDSVNNEIVYTDSYGPGHEANKKSVVNAYSETDYLTVFIPTETEFALRVR